MDLSGLCLHGRYTRLFFSLLPSLGYMVALVAMLFLYILAFMVLFTSFCGMRPM